jgi:hypothetical protein
MVASDLAWTELAAEFRACPFGNHSPALQALLNQMRLPANGMNLLLVQVAADRWLLAERLPGGVPPRVIPGKPFASREAAEVHVFDLRLERLAKRQDASP